MIKAVAYARVSTAMQKDEVSLDTQIDAIKEYAEANGFHIIKEIKEVFSGAELFERPLLSECRDGIRRGDFSALIVYDVDRLSRNIGHLAILMDECKRYNAHLLFVRSEFNDSIEGKILFSIQGIFAEAERLKIIERTGRGRRAKAKIGTLSFKRKLYGYDLDADGKRVINEIESAIVKEMFAAVIGGKSLREIAVNLNDRKIPTPSGKTVWWANSVKVLLNNPAYIGRTTIFRQKKVKKYRKGERYETTVEQDASNFVEMPDVTPAIISPKDFEKVQSILKQNKTAKRSRAKREFLLRGRLRCDRCGRLMSPQVAHGWRAYVCTSKQNPTENCGIKLASADKVENAIWAEISKIIKNPNRIKKHLRKGEKKDVNLTNDFQQVGSLIAKTEKEISNLIERGASVDDALWQIIKEKLEIKRTELDRLRAAKAELAVRLAQVKQFEVNEQNINTMILKIRPNVNNLSFAEKVAVLDDFDALCVWDGENLTLMIGDEQYYGKSDSNNFYNNAVLLPRVKVPCLV